MSKLLEACRSLVLFKYNLDDQIHRLWKNSNKRLWGAAYYSVAPWHFINPIFPFYSYDFEQEPTTEELDPFQIVGGTYQSYKNENDGSEKVCDILNSGSFDDPGKYEKLGELPLYLAREGKNRVRLFQKHNRKVKAKIVHWTLSPPTSLRLYRTLLSRQYLLSCADHRFIHKEDTIILPFPDVTVPLYQAYGVQVARRFLLPLSVSAKREAIENRIKRSNLER
ncbi:MAG TPA: hypothetical protein VF604_08150 [Pyrinomonadaceae bacterium]